MSVGILNGNTYGSYIIKASLTPSEVATIAAPEQTFNVPGLHLNDIVHVAPPSNVNGVALVGARVSAADTLALKFVNPTEAGVTPASGEYIIHVTRPESGVAKQRIGD